MMDALSKLTSTLGTGLALYLSYKTVENAWLYLRPSSLHRYLYRDDKGRRAWAFVTGASDGIGKALAFELAGHGFNIVLHGRNPSKLDGVAVALRKAHTGVETRIVVADASQCHRSDAVDFARIRDDVADLHLTVLVNCAGSGARPTFGMLESYSSGEILDNLHLNAMFPTLLTATLLPVLKRRYRKHGSDNEETETGSSSPLSASKPALIINIGSVSDDGFPLISFYSAGKIAGHALHQALAREAALEGLGSGLEVISHRIAGATGVAHTKTPPTLFTPDASTIARAVLARTGCGRKSVVPYLPHALAQGFMSVLPDWALDGMIISALKAESLAKAAEAKTKE